jgi:SAM-dependent methyltransferase
LRAIREVIRTAISPDWLLNRRMDGLTRDALSAYVNEGSDWLDVGCGLKPFASSFKQASYTGIDVEVSGRSENLKKPDKFFDGINIPYKNSKFDGILSTQVLEHVENLDLLLAECNRVLKAGGAFVVSVPFVYREHEQPHDFRRFTSYGLTQVLSRHGFKVESCLKCLSAIETITTLFCVYLSNNIGSWNKFSLVTIGCLVTIPALLLSVLLSKILPDNGDLYCTLVLTSIKTNELTGESS